MLSLEAGENSALPSTSEFLPAKETFPSRCPAVSAD